MHAHSATISGQNEVKNEEWRETWRAVSAIEQDGVEAVPA